MSDGAAGTQGFSARLGEAEAGGGLSCLVFRGRPPPREPLWGAGALPTDPRLRPQLQEPDCRLGWGWVQDGRLVD